VKRIVAAVFLLALLAGGCVIYSLNRPYAGFDGEVFVEVPRGTAASRIAEMLADAGVVQSRWLFLAARAFYGRKTLQAGEYRFHQAASPIDVYGRIARGDIFFYELVVPEGRNMFDIGEAVHGLGLFSAADFVRVARDPALIRDLDPKAPSLEGYLFPSTYRLGRHTTPEKLARLMTAKFRDAWHGLGSKADVHRTVTLASLVEKEGKLAPERPQIAAVFLKRLEIGMKLDCDPTTIYAALLDGRWRGTIYRSDLDSDNPYNTYRHTGLPPGPIANPGLASIRAVLDPAAGDALYFVARADGSGGHTFSRDLASQQAAVVEYRRGLHGR
jgi:UPF0755 protein